jgi:hypothetical protein
MLGAGIHEVPGARAHEDKDWNTELGLTGTEQLKSGRGAAMGEIGAQLDAVGSTLGSRERSLQGFNGCLDENGHMAKFTRTKEIEERRTAAPQTTSCCA